MLLSGLLFLFGAMMATAEDPCLVCPPVPEGRMGICVEMCGTGCKDGQLCCSNGCGHVCMNGTIPICCQPAKVGKCKARIERYYYDPETNDCKLFYYGGCDANENNFEEKADCEKWCLKSDGISEEDICNLPKDQGQENCVEDQLVRYFYNTDTMMCEEFMYSGCGEGNLNNFEDIESCKQSCVACSQPKKIGPCKGAFPRYFYNSTTGQCEDFLYGGCRGNKNNFKSAEQCEMKCAPKEKSDICTLPAKDGKCKASIERYYYDPETNDCKLFYYGGCDANENNFEEKADCEKQCLKSDGRGGDVTAEEDICNLPKDEGKKKCAEDQLVRYFYNTDTMMCEEFMYSGCGKGNLNNFEDIESCKQSCVACSQPKKIGPCKGAFPRYFYNSTTGQCEDFLYGGCRGNKNNFKSAEQCEMYCKPTCEFYCQKCKGKNILSKCLDCKQRKVVGHTKCAACVELRKGKFTHQCFNCMK